MNENLNLVEILKDCPKGTRLYSPMCGDVVLSDISTDKNYSIKTIAQNGDICYFTAKGQFYVNFPDSECLLFPSKEQRDWSKFTAPKPKPVFKPYDRVVVKGKDEWRCEIFSHYHGDFATTISNRTYEPGEILPYEGNEHLVGEEVDE